MTNFLGRCRLDGGKRRALWFDEEGAYEVTERARLLALSSGRMEDALSGETR